MILCGSLIIAFLENYVNPFLFFLSGIFPEISDRRSKIRRRYFLEKYSYKQGNRKRFFVPVLSCFYIVSRQRAEPGGSL